MTSLVYSVSTIKKIVKMMIISSTFKRKSFIVNISLVIEIIFLFASTPAVLICDRYDNHSRIKNSLALNCFLFCNCHNSSDIGINSKSRFISLATTNSTETKTLIMNNANATSINFKISF